MQCALLSQLVLPLLAAAHEAGRAGEVLNTECLEVLSSVFRVSDTHSVLFGEWLRLHCGEGSMCVCMCGESGGAQQRVPGVRHTLGAVW